MLSQESMFTFPPVSLESSPHSCSHDKNGMQPAEDIHDQWLRSRDRSSPSARAYRLALGFLPLLASSLALWALLHAWHVDLLPSYLRHHYASPDTPSPVTTCGTSPSEARSRGCRFDVLSFAWQAPECFDEEILDEFVRYNDWKFYTQPDNRNTSATVDLATAMEGERTLYVDWEYHVVHCTFAWRQLHRAYALRGYVDSHLDSYKHTVHCQWALLQREKPLDSVTVVAALKYPACRRIGEGKR